MNTGAGDASLLITVDGYGAFGSVVDDFTADAIYDPVGPTPSETSVFESGIAIRANQASGTRTWYSTSSIGMGQLPSIPVNGNSTSATSSFTTGLGLSAALGQTVSKVFDENNAWVGSKLTQTYTLTNTTASAMNFEVVRYMDADLIYSGTGLSDDGGGYLLVGNTEYLFETETATGASASNTFVGITSTGGTINANNRWMIDNYSDLRTLVGNGGALNQTIQGDGPDADLFVDAGPGYDVTLAMRNLYSAGAGQTVTYVTTTTWGSLAPENIPEPTTLAVLAGAAGLMLRRRSAR